MNKFQEKVEKALKYTYEDMSRETKVYDVTYYNGISYFMLDHAWQFVINECEKFCLTPECNNGCHHYLNYRNYTIVNYSTGHSGFISNRSVRVGFISHHKKFISLKEKVTHWYRRCPDKFSEFMHGHLRHAYNFYRPIDSYKTLGDVIDDIKHTKEWLDSYFVFRNVVKFWDKK